MNINDDEDEEEQRPLTAADVRALLDEQDARHKKEIRLQEERMRLLEEATDRRLNNLEQASSSAGATQTNDEILPLTDNRQTFNTQLTPDRPRRENAERLSFLFFRRDRNEGGSSDHEEAGDDNRSEGLEEDTFSLMMMNKPFREIPCCHPTLLGIICLSGFLGMMILAYDFLVVRIPFINDTMFISLLAAFVVMIFAPLSCPWLLSMFTSFWLQLILGLYIIHDQTVYQSGALGCGYAEPCVPFHIPLGTDLGLVTAKYLTVFFALATQNDIFSSLQTLGKLRNADHVPWDVVIGQPGNRTWGLWICRILLPNMFKFIQASVIIFATFIVIIQTTSIVDLLKDFTALLVVSEADNIMFHIASLGYFGENLKKKTDKVKAVRWMMTEYARGEGGDTDEEEEEEEKPHPWCSCCNMSSCFFFTLAMVMVGGLTYFVVGQYSGTFLKTIYPKCDVLYPQRIGNRWCDDYAPYNTAECGWDGGDCPEPTNVEGYINCTVSFPDKIGDEWCDWAPYNTPECGYDGGDCDPSE